VCLIRELGVPETKGGSGGLTAIVDYHKVKMLP